MSVEEEQDDSISFEKKLRRYKLLKVAAIVVATAGILGTAIFFLYKFANRQFDNYEVITSVDRSDSNTVKYMKYKDKILKYSRDGASVINGSGGTPLWNKSYDMKTPEADICEDYIAIADIGNKEVSVFDKDGNMRTIEVLYPIAGVKVANQGVIAIFMEGDDTNIFELHNPFSLSSNTRLYGARLSVKDGFAIDFDLSNDGYKMVVSYLTITNGLPVSEVVFYNFSDIGASSNGTVGGFTSKEGTMIHEVEFVSNNTVCAYGNDMFYIYSMKQLPELKFDLDPKFKTEIRSKISSSKYIGFVFDTVEPENKYRLLLYNLSGELVLDLPFDYDYNTIQLIDEEIILLSDNEAVMIETNGKIRFHGTFEDPVSFIMPAKGLNKYYIINSKHIEQISLVEDKEK